MKSLACFLIVFGPFFQVVLAETMTLKGIVIDTDGKPIADVSVYLEQDALKPDKVQITGSDGRFALPVPLEEINSWMSVYAVSPEKERLGEGRPKLKEGSMEIPELSIELKPARIITGNVVDSDGKPAEGILVGGIDQTPYPNFTRTDKDGVFRFAYPKDDTVPLQQVFALSEEKGLDFVCTEELEKFRGKIPPEKIKDGPFELKLMEYAPVKLRVVDEAKKPLAGMNAHPWLIGKKGEKDRLNFGRLCTLFHVKTDAEGIAVLKMVPKAITDGTYLCASCPKEGIAMPDGTRLFFSQNNEKRWADFDKKEKIPTLTMKKKGRAKGTVKLPDGTPVPWTRISIKRHNACGHGIRWTNPKGEFEFAWSEAGALVDVGVESELGAAPGVFGFNVGDGVEEKRLDFVLEKGIRLHGTVYAPDGKPSEKYQITFYEKCPADLLESIRSMIGVEKTCSTGGCAEGIVIRQTSDYFEPNSEGKYEYILPAVARKYDFSAFSYANPEWVFKQEDFAIAGDEKEIRLDIRLKPKSSE